MGNGFYTLPVSLVTCSEPGGQHGTESPAGSRHSETTGSYLPKRKDLLPGPVVGPPGGKEPQEPLAFHKVNTKLSRALGKPGAVYPSWRWAEKQQTD